MAGTVEVRQTAGRRVPLRLIERVAAAAGRRHARLQRVTLSVAIVGDAQMRRLNRIYHGVDKTTDVLTFSLREEGLVELIVCYDQAARQARVASWSIASEIQLLVAHGLLHAAGFDDQKPVDEKRMRREEAAVLASLRRR